MKTVLVNDSDEDRGSLITALRGAGFRVMEEMESGDRLRRAVEEVPGAIIMDEDSPHRWDGAVAGSKEFHRLAHRRERVRRMAGGRPGTAPGSGSLSSPIGERLKKSWPASMPCCAAAGPGQDPPKGLVLPMVAGLTSGKGRRCKPCSG